MNPVNRPDRVMDVIKTFGKVYTPAWVVDYMLVPLFKGSMKSLRIALRSTRPGNLDRVHPRGRLAPRYPAVDKTSKLKPVQVPPRPLLTVVIQRPRLSRLRADQRTTRMGNVDVYPFSLRIQKQPINLPITP